MRTLTRQAGRWAAGRWAGEDALELGMRLVTASPRRYPLTPTQLRRRVVAALGIGATVAASLRARWPDDDALAVAAALGLRVEERECDEGVVGDGGADAPELTTPPRRRLAALEDGSRIVVCPIAPSIVAGAMVELLRARCEGAAGHPYDWTALEHDWTALALNLLVAHELFHHLEQGVAHLGQGVAAAGWPHAPGGRVSVRLGYPSRFLGLRYRAAIPELSEVAAHAFSSCLVSPPVCSLAVHARLMGWI